MRVLSAVLSNVKRTGIYGVMQEGMVYLMGAESLGESQDYPLRCVVVLVCERVWLWKLSETVHPFVSVRVPYSACYYYCYCVSLHMPSVPTLVLIPGNPLPPPPT